MFIITLLLEIVQPIRDLKQTEAMKSILKDKNFRDFVFFALGLNTGLRVSDLLNLTVGEVWQNNKPAKFIETREQKINKVKRFILNQTAKKALKDYEYLKTAGPDETLFPSRKGNQAISRVQADVVKQNCNTST